MRPLLSVAANWTANPAETPASVVGTWQLIDYSQQFLDTKQITRPFGDHPTGYIQYSPGGHMVVFLTTGNTPKPAAAMFSDAERIAFYNRIIGGYAGTYRIEGNKVIHHILASWQPEWIGSDQTRFFEVNGKHLTIKTAPLKYTRTGQDIIGMLTFGRVE
ncbi:MAG: lipocalin-like domain-containing protein [Acetobacteraceae bacterium]|nr:lipocalin-like domain-containing protein [Acetobacteraceae bacterium]MBV8523072.1 lipocalin-like domain-containing protein [Acetobacteraceae bacterium]